MGRVGIKNRTREKFVFLPYRESFDIALQPQDAISIQTITDEEKLYYEVIAKDLIEEIPGTIFEANFTGGNNGLFGYYGTVEDGPFGTILLTPDSSDIGPMTYFRKINRNTPLGKGTTKVRVGIVIDNGQMNTGEYFNINLGLNDIRTNGAYNLKLEKCLYFRKYDEGVKVGYTDGDSLNKTNQTATSNAGSVVLPDGDYTVEFEISKENNELILTICVLNLDNSLLFRVTDIKLGVTKVEELGGIRHLWLSNATAPWVELIYLSIIEK